MNYSYDTIVNDNDKKCSFLERLYKLNLSNTDKSVREIFKSKEHKIYFCRPELLSLRATITHIEQFEGENEAVVPKLSEALINAYRLYAIFVRQEEKSLLDDKERQKFHQEIELIKGDITKNYLSLCKNLEHEKIFDEKCNRKRLFLELIKI
jgi:hypothetical protein